MSEISIPGRGQVPFPKESPNHGGPLVDPTIIVLHSTGGNYPGCYNWMMEKRATGNVSAHFVVTRSGSIIQLVSIHKQAWHAGVSAWNGREGCNAFSIGIEQEHIDGKQDWPEAQVQATAALVKALLKACPTINKTVGHFDIAPGRKIDPKGFPWEHYRDLVRG